MLFHEMISRIRRWAELKITRRTTLGSSACIKEGKINLHAKTQEILTLVNP